MASIFKNIRTIPLHNKEMLNMLPYFSISKLGSRLSSKCGSCKNTDPTLYDYRKLGHNLSTDNVQPCFETLENIPSGVFRETSGETRKIGHNLSSDNVKPPFDTLKNIPSGVFRDTKGEVLGLGAGKSCCYKNPEYFSFHHMSFFDLNLGLRQYRKTCPKSSRKPN